MSTDLAGGWMDCGVVRWARKTVEGNGWLWLAVYYSFWVEGDGVARQNGVCEGVGVLGLRYAYVALQDLSLVGEREAVGVFGGFCGWGSVLNYTMSLGSLLS